MVELFKFERKNGKEEVRDDDDGGFFGGLFKRKGHEAAEKVQAEKKGEKVILRGRVPRREVAEKMIVETGNTRGVSEVESHLEIDDEKDDAAKDRPKVKPARFYTVKSGDTLSKIAKEAYGDASKYPVIFEANKPTLKDPDEIYPGQVLRIPSQDGGTA